MTVGIRKSTVVGFRMQDQEPLGVHLDGWESFGHRFGVFGNALRSASVRGRGDASSASSGQEQHRSTATERCSELNHRTRSASTNSGRNQIASKRSVSLSSERPTPSTDLTKSRDVSREKDSPTPETFDTHLALNQDAPAEPADTRLQNESGATRDHGNESHVSSAVNELSRAKAMNAYRVGQPQSLEADETVFKPAIMTPPQTQTNESCFAERPGPLDQAPEPMQPLIRSEKALQMPAKDQPAAAPVVEQATTAAERLQRPLETVQRTSTCTGTDEVPAAARQTLSVTTHDVIRTFRQRADTSSSGISRLEYRLIRSGCLSSPSLRSDGPGACSDQLAAVAAQSTRVGSGHRSGIRNESTSLFPGSAFRETMRPTPPRTSLLARSTSLERSPLLGGYRELVRTATLTPVTAAAASPSRPGSQIAPAAGRFSPVQHRSNERTLGGADRMATHDQLVPNSFEKGDFPPDAAQVATRALKLPSVPIGTLRLPDRQLVGRPRTYWELSTPALPMTVADRAAAFHGPKSDAGSLWRAEEQRTPGAVSGNATTPNEAMIPSSGTLKRRRLITPNAELNTMTQVSGGGNAHRSFTTPQETRLASAASSSRLHQLIQSLKKSPSRSEDDAKARFRRNDNHEDSVVTESETAHVLPQSVLAGQRQAGHDLGLDCSAELDAALDRMAQAIAARTKRHAVQRAAETGTTHPSTKLVPATWAPCPIPERATPPKTAEDDHVSGADGNTGQVDPSALDRESHLCSVSAYAAPTFGEATKKRRQTVTQATDAHTRDWLPGSSPSRTVAEQSLVRARDAGKSSLGPRMITAPNDDDDDSGSGPREGTLLASLPSGSQQLAVTLPRIPEPWRPPSPPSTPPSTPPKSQFGAAKPEMIPMNADQAADTTSALTTKAASLSSEAAVFSSVEVPPHAQGPRTNEKADILPIPVRAEAATETRTSSITGSERDESAAKSLLLDGTTLVGTNPPICIEKSLNQELHCEAAVKMS
ncbi:hypothetical protein F1559_003283 [Cyanidiococcus yangmingshanensis]|uniref:Uncharacterized protein n=1 Tax=Cyanidiococcus yangmingshanensis TaxID=2690220 RepID=A0A7J7IKS6_9RHOD|nr:hypothetical protein F1559_003283 [Cyanidiococcus yangmingshanensis]